MICPGSKNPAGYTLLEIGLALGIMTLIFLAVAPAADGFLAERRIRRVSDQLVDLAAELRNQAKTSGIFQKVTFSKNGILSSDGAEVPIPGELQCFLKRETGKWQKLDGQVWRFAPSGMVEPLSVRWEKGSDWLELDFDVLTAMVVDERYSF